MYNSKCGLLYERGIKVKAICVDIGGTSIKYGLLEQKNARQKVEVLFKASADWKPKEIDGTGVSQFVYNLIKDILESETIDFIGVSTAGVVDVDSGHIVSANDNIPNYTGYPLKDELERLIKKPVAVENDVNSATLAEFYQGHTQGTQSNVCLTIGTGVGGGAILAGELFRGHNHSAMEVGYIPIENTTLEDGGSTTGLVRRCEARLNSNEPLNGKKIFDLIKHEQNKVCIEEVDVMVKTIAKGLEIISYVIDPEKIVLGGGIMQQSDYLILRIQKELDQLINKHIPVEAAKHLNNAGMVGAFYHAKKQIIGDD